MKKLLLALSLLLICISAFVSCAGGGGDENKKYRVMVSVDSGAAVIGENPVDIEEGSSVTFDVSVDADYEFVSVSHGTYNADTGKLTVENVTERINISFVTKLRDMSHLKEYNYDFIGEAEDTTLPSGDSKVKIGDQINVKSRYTQKNFIGWSIGKPYVGGGKIVSVNREYTFPVTLEMITDDVLRVYANYEDKEKFTVNLNAFDGAVISGEKSREVYEGESVTFDISVSQGYEFVSVTHGTYDKLTGKLTVNNITQNTDVYFVTRMPQVDSRKFLYVFSAKTGDTTEPASLSYVKIGDTVNLKSVYSNGTFFGWSIGKSYLEGGDIVSTEREYSFTVSEELIIGEALIVYANYGKEKFNVTVNIDSGAEIIGNSTVEIEKGNSAIFDIAIKSGYGFVSVNHGSYNFETGKLTVSNVTKNINVSFITEELGYDTNETCNYVFYGGIDDVTYPSASSSVRLGTNITVTSKTSGKIFLGWSIGKSYADGAEIISEDKTYTFRAEPNKIADGDLLVYANYIDANIFYYDPNGGSINSHSANMVHTKYYTAKSESGKVKVTLGSKYFEYSECASTFWNDGTFTREGYVLKEYNTKADGSGEGYSLGSKFYTVTDSATQAVLYCIWEEATENFEYEDFTFARPSGVTAARSPDWHPNGVIITKYNGNDETVAIPEKLGGKYVIAIAENAFNAKDIKTLVMSRYLLSVADGAFKSCPQLKTVYYSDGIYSISDAAFDAETLPSIKNLYVNATIAPRYANSTEAAFSAKLSRILASQEKNRVIVISGSSSYRGLSTLYLEALLENEYRVINFGTTRTTHGTIYLEAMKYLAHEGDIIVYAPENSAYMMGEPEFYWKTLRDLESMYNLFRYIDISNYTGVFTAFSAWNQGRSYTEEYMESHPGRYERNAGAYEQIGERASSTDKYGDSHGAALLDYCNLSAYKDSYYITLNNRIKSKYEGAWSNKTYQELHKDYTNLNDETWISIDDEPYVTLMNRAFDAARSSGAKVYFGFAPIDGESIVPEAQNLAHFRAYEKLIENIYHIDGLMGSCKDYIYARKYCYDCAYHTNAYGRTYRTYQLYLDIADTLGIENPNGIYSKGTNFEGCLFENNSNGKPLTQINFK